jgi:hypothetical protein
MDRQGCSANDRTGISCDDYGSTPDKAENAVFSIARLPRLVSRLQHLARGRAASGQPSLTLTLEQSSE